MSDLVSIISSLIIILFPYLGKIWFSRQVLASTVVSLGLLGTFGGIFLGLINFDVLQIENALPQLLEGLKTAFLTSIAGMISSLILRLFPILYGIKAEQHPQEDSMAEQMITILSAIEKNTANKESLLLETLEKIQHTNEEKLTALNNTLMNFARDLGQINTQALNSAFAEIVKQWDSNISQQIHQTLQEINSSIQHLSDLQQTTNTDLKNVLEKLHNTNNSLGTYLSQSVHMNSRQQETITTQMTNLGHLVETTEKQLDKQITDMEERFRRELSAMEQFTQTLISIIKKLSQDHSVVGKRRQELELEDENSITNN